MAFAQSIQLRLNRVGGICDNNGRRHSQLLRERVLDLRHDGMSPQLIANEVQSSRHFVRNVFRGYDLNNSSMPKERERPPRSKLEGICSGIFRKWKTLQAQHYKFRAATRRDCSSGWLTIKVSDFKMYKGRPCHDKEKDSTGTIRSEKANKYWTYWLFSKSS